MLLPEVVITAKDAEGLASYEAQKAMLVPSMHTGGVRMMPDILDKEVLQPMSLRLKKPSPLPGQSGCFVFGWGVMNGIGGTSARLKHGFSLLEKGELQRAHEAFAKAASKARGQDRNAAAAWFWTAETAYEQARRRTAWEAYQKVMANPNAGEYLELSRFSLGWLAYQDRQYAIARKHLREVSKSQAESKIRALGLFMAGQCSYFLGEYDLSRREFSAVVREYPEFPFKNQALFWAAESFYHVGDYEQAIANFRRFLNENPQDELADDAAYGMAWSYVGKGDAAQALHTLEYATRNYPESNLQPNFQYWLGRLYRDTGEHEDAARSFELVQKEHSAHAMAVQATRALAWMRFDDGEYREAIKQFSYLMDTATEADLRNEAGFMVGESWYNLRNYEAAITAYGKVLSAPMPLGAKAAYRSGWCRLVQGQWGAARKFFELVRDNYADLDFQEELLFWTAECAYREGEVETARKLYSEILDKWPSGEWSDDARFGLGWIAAERGEWQAAGMAFEALLKLHPESRLRDHAQFKRGEAAFHGSDLDTAEHTFKQLHEHNPLGPLGDDALFALGRIAEKRKLYAHARNYYSEFQALYPQSSLADDALIQEGWTWFAEGRFAQARERWTQLSEWFPQSSRRMETQFRIGETYYNEGKMAEARRRYETVLANDPTSSFAAEAVYSLVMSYLRENDISGLESAARQLVARDATGTVEPLISFSLGEAYFGDKRYEQALGAFRKVPADSANGELAAYRMAQCYQETGSLSEALAAYQALIKAYPGRPYAREAELSAAELLMDLGRPQEALPMLEAATQAEGKSELAARAWMLIGRLQVQGEEEAQAEAAFRSAVSADPGEFYATAARTELGDLLRQQAGREREALELLATAAGSGRLDQAARAQYLLGETYAQTGDAAQARAEFLKVNLLFPNQRIWADLGLLKAAELYLRAGDEGSARRSLQLLEALTTDGKMKLRAQEELRRLGGRE